MTDAPATPSALDTGEEIDPDELAGDPVPGDVDLSHLVPEADELEGDDGV